MDNPEKHVPNWSKLQTHPFCLQRAPIPVDLIEIRSRDAIKDVFAAHGLNKTHPWSVLLETVAQRNAVRAGTFGLAAYWHTSPSAAYEILPLDERGVPSDSTVEALELAFYHQLYTKDFCTAASVFVAICKRCDEIVGGLK